MVGRHAEPSAPGEEHESSPHVQKVPSAVCGRFDRHRGIVAKELVGENEVVEVDAPRSEAQLHARAQVQFATQAQVVCGLPHELEPAQGTCASLFVADQEAVAHAFVQCGAVVSQMESREGLWKRGPLRPVKGSQTGLPGHSSVGRVDGRWRRVELSELLVLSEHR